MILQGRVAGADAILRWAILRCDNIEEDVTHAGRRRRPTDERDTFLIAQRRHSGIRHFGYHINLAGAQCLYQRVLIVKGLEDRLIYLRPLEVMILDRSQSYKLILAVLFHAERATANHRFVFKGKDPFSFQRPPNMLR